MEPSTQSRKAKAVTPATLQSYLVNNEYEAFNKSRPNGPLTLEVLDLKKVYLAKFDLSHVTLRLGQASNLEIRECSTRPDSHFVVVPQNPIDVKIDACPKFSFKTTNTKINEIEAQRCDAISLSMAFSQISSVSVYNCHVAKLDLRQSEIGGLEVSRCEDVSLDGSHLRAAKVALATLGHVKADFKYSNFPEVVVNGCKKGEIQFALVSIKEFEVLECSDLESLRFVDSCLQVCKVSSPTVRIGELSITGGSLLQLRIASAEIGAVKVNTQIQDGEPYLNEPSIIVKASHIAKIDLNFLGGERTNLRCEESNVANLSILGNLHSIRLCKLEAKLVSILNCTQTEIEIKDSKLALKLEKVTVEGWEIQDSDLEKAHLEACTVKNLKIAGRNTLGKLKVESSQGVQGLHVLANAFAKGGRVFGEEIGQLLKLAALYTDFPKYFQHCQALVQHAKLAVAFSQIGIKDEPFNLHLMLETGSARRVELLSQHYLKLLKELGIVPDTGTTKRIECSALMGEYVGQTAPHTRKQLEAVKGGIAFIPDYNSFFDSGDESFGKIAFRTINSILQRNPPPFILVASVDNTKKSRLPDDAQRFFKNWLYEEKMSVEQTAHAVADKLVSDGLTLDATALAAIYLVVVRARRDLGTELSAETNSKLTQEYSELSDSMYQRIRAAHRLRLISSLGDIKEGDIKESDLKKLKTISSVDVLKAGNVRCQIHDLLGIRFKVAGKECSWLEFSETWSGIVNGSVKELALPTIVESSIAKSALNI